MQISANGLVFFIQVNFFITGEYIAIVQCLSLIMISNPDPNPVGFSLLLGEPVGVGSVAGGGRYDNLVGMFAKGRKVRNFNQTICCSFFFLFVVIFSCFMVSLLNKL